VDRRGLRLVLGEDSLIAREGIVSLLHDAGDVEVVAVCCDLPSLRDAVERLRPDVVLTDIRLPPSETDEGIRLAAELRASHPEIAVVILSQHVELLYAVALLGDGAQRRGYLGKDRVKNAAELGSALRDVVSGGSAIDSRVIEQMLAYWAGPHESALASLTPREREVLAQIATGRSNAAIADVLGVSRRAVERHIGAIFAKLGLAERDDIAPRVQATLLFLADQQAGRMPHDGA
jgi:DNA-binding NarL/FixJ family response regulator